MSKIDFFFREQELGLRFFNLFSFLNLPLFCRDTSTAKARAKSGGAESLLRMRSNSLSDHSPEKRNRHSTGVTAQSSQQQQLTLPSLNQDQDVKRDKMMAFHSELSDTCVDILSTYAYANLSAKPKRIGGSFKMSGKVLAKLMFFFFFFLTYYSNSRLSIEKWSIGILDHWHENSHRDNKHM